LRALTSFWVLIGDIDLLNIFVVVAARHFKLSLCDSFNKAEKILQKYNGVTIISRYPILNGLYDAPSI